MTVLLAEPLVKAMIKTLEERLPAAVEEVNSTVTDGITVETPAQYLRFMPFLAALGGGFPIICVQRLRADFVDDLQFNVDAIHEYAVIAVLQNSDHETLALQLERTMQAIASAVSADRLAGPASTMRTEGGAFSVNWERYEPGPLFGDLDPNAENAPPRSYLTYAGLVFSSRRTEV